MQDKVRFTDTEKDAIRDTVSRILDHPSFRTSERSTRLFRYLLDRALSNDVEAPKERQIGHEVFGREVSYDTAADPVVRNAASETRKRLKQYDAERGSAEPVHILLAAGAYALDFRFSEPSAAPGQDKSSDTNAVSSIEPAAISGRMQRPKSSLWRSLWFAYGIAVIATACCVALSVALLHQRETAKQITRVPDPLWDPMFASGKEIFISLGHADPYGSENPSADFARGGLQRITVTDLKAYTNISGFLQTNRQPFQMRTDNQTTLLDLRDRPAVLIGNHNNDWARRLTADLRYRFDFDEAHEGKPDRTFTIVDSEKPDQRLWQVPVGGNRAAPFDYAIAGRMLDPVTGGLVLFVAGCGSVGTQAASEFVTQPQFLRSLPKNLNDPKVSIQVVLKTPIMAGVAGSPEVIATHIW
jgi:hypothetical protein